MVRFRRRFGMLTVTAVGAVLGAVLPATAASAAVPGLVYISAETNFDSTVFKSVRVSCPAGQQVIGGGYDLLGAEGAVVLDDFIPSPTNLLVSAGEIVGPGENSDGTTASWKVVATVVCANPLPGYSIWVATSSFTATTGNAARAFCPSGQRVVSGGASLSNGFGQVSTVLLDVGTVFVEADARTDGDGYSGSWSVSAYAICANQLPGWNVVQQVSPSGPFTSRTETASCGVGQVQIGVGWRTFFNLAGIGDRYFTRASISTANRGATVSAVSATPPTEAWELAVRAVCVDP
jgi:hypothetical protein